MAPLINLLEMGLDQDRQAIRRALESPPVPLRAVRARSLCWTEFWVSRRQAGRSTAPFAEFESLRRSAGGGPAPSIPNPNLRQRASHSGFALFLWPRPTPRSTLMTKRPLKRLVREEVEKLGVS